MQTRPKKLLQYMSCGLASVSSTTDVTSYIIKDGVNGFLVSTNSQWLKKIKFLLENPDRRKTVVEKARKSIDGKFDSKTTALKYAAVFKEIEGSGLHSLQIVCTTCQSKMNCRQECSPAPHVM